MLRRRYESSRHGRFEGSTANHIGFLVKDYAPLKAKLAAANIPTVFDMEKNKQ